MWGGGRSLGGVSEGGWVWERDRGPRAGRARLGNDIGAIEWRWSNGSNVKSVWGWGGGAARAAYFMACLDRCSNLHISTSLIRNTPPVSPYNRTMPRALW